jgi:cytochrome c oxidase subunit IV
MAEHHPFDPRSPGHGYEAAAADQEHGHAGVGKYVAVFIALCVLTAISFAVGNSATLRHNSPGTMWAAMMAVSCAKAMLVILFFMHLLWEANWKYVLTIPSAMMSIFLLLMLVPDIGRRTDRYSEERWLYAAEPKEKTEDEHGQASDHSNHDHDKGHTDHKSGQPKH